MKNLSPLVLTTFGQPRDRKGRKRYTHQCIIHARLVHWWVLVHVGLLGVLCAPASLVLVCYSFSKMSFEKGPLCPCLLSNWLVAPIFLIAFHGLLSISLNMISISARSSIHPSLNQFGKTQKKHGENQGFQQVVPIPVQQLQQMSPSIFGTWETPNTYMTCSYYTTTYNKVNNTVNENDEVISSQIEC